MKKIKSLVSAVALVAAFGASSAMAQGFPKLPSFGGGSGSATVNGAQMAKSARNALHAFAKAEVGLAKALGGYGDLAAQQALLDGLKAGDAAAQKNDIETIVSISKSASEAINKKVAENAQLDGENKLLAAKSMTDYVKGLVASKKLVSSVQDLTKNPTALGLDAGTLLYVGKEIPGIVSGGASTTSTLFKYLGSNGVDLSEAKAAAQDLGV